jgi:hypothetical protein
MKAFYKTTLYHEAYAIMDRIQSAPTIYEGVCAEIPNALFKAKKAAKDFKRRPMHIALALLVIKYGEIQIFVSGSNGFKCQFSDKNNYAITNFGKAYAAMNGRYVNLKTCKYL